jgi:hypothetical protein
MSSSGFRIQTPEIEDDEESIGETRKGLEREVLVTSTRDNQTSEDESQLKREAVATKSKPRSTASTAPAKQATLKSFFTFHSQPKAKQAEASSSTIRVESSDTSTASTSSKPKLAQLHLVPVRHSTSTTTRPTLLTTCPKCNMSYIRGGIGGQDDTVHRAHCVRVTEGVKWDSKAADTGSVTMTGAKLASWRRKGAKTAGGVVVRRDVEFGEAVGKGKAVGSVVCVEGYEAATDKRVSTLDELRD